MNKYLTATVFWAFAVLPLGAGADADLQRLSRALGLPQIIAVMHDEGVSYGDELAESMFPNGADAGWRDTVAEIYDIDRMGDVALADFAENLDSAEVSELTGFFESPLGVEIIALEIAARRALLDDALDAANKAITARMIADKDPRIDLIRQFIVVNDLLETNIVGALNSSYAFYIGLVDGGAFRDAIPEDKILADVWQQEPDIRLETDEWLYGFLTLAYSPLSDADLVAYIEFSETAAGQALNSALFAGFDEMFEGISRALGLAAAKVMSSRQL